MAYSPDADDTGRPSLDHHLPIHRLLLNLSYRVGHDAKSGLWYRLSLCL